MKEYLHMYIEQTVKYDNISLQIFKFSSILLLHLVKLMELIRHALFINIH